LHAGSGRLQGIDPLDRYGKEDRLRSVALEKGGNADQIAVAIEQATARGMRQLSG
jgi:hypothetical protein